MNAKRTDYITLQVVMNIRTSEINVLHTFYILCFICLFLSTRIKINYAT